MTQMIGDSPSRSQFIPSSTYEQARGAAEAWGAGRDDEFRRAASPWQQLNLPQLRVEPLLRAGAEELSLGRIRFNHELTSLEQDEDGVRASIRDNGSGRGYTVHSDYVLGADGGRLVPTLIGVSTSDLVSSRRRRRCTCRRTARAGRRITTS